MKRNRIVRIGSLALVITGVMGTVGRAPHSRIDIPSTPTPAAGRNVFGATAYAAQPARPVAAAPVVAGMTSDAAAAVAAEPRPTDAPASAVPRDRRAALDALDTELIRQRALPEPASDAFAAKSWFVAPPPPPPPPAPPPPPPPPPPQAPPLPFKYIGMLEESAERTVWYLVHGERLIVAATGDVIDNTYRIDGADAGQLRFTYVPLDQRQTLAIGVPP